MNSPSPSEPRPRAQAALAIITCGAISREAMDWAAGKDVAVYPLPPVLHNHPERIAPAVEAEIIRLRTLHDDVAVAYADCGSYGALDEVCERYGVTRLPERHCYDLLSTPDTLDAQWAAEPGTFILIDFTVVAFDRMIWRELGLDRHPELRDDYFGHFTKVVWLAGRQTPDLERAAQRAADRLGLPLEIWPVGAGLDPHLSRLVASRGESDVQNSS
jgi:hypothetical protein